MKKIFGFLILVVIFSQCKKDDKDDDVFVIPDNIYGEYKHFGSCNTTQFGYNTNVLVVKPNDKTSIKIEANSEAFDYATIIVKIQDDKLIIPSQVHDYQGISGGLVNIIGTGVHSGNQIYLTFSKTYTSNSGHRSCSITATK